MFDKERSYWIWAVRFFLLLAVTATGCSSPSAETCLRMKSIGSDPEKVAYLRGWIADDLSKDETLALFGQLGRIDAIDDRLRFLALGLDLETLDIDDTHGFVHIYFYPFSGDTPTREKKIVAVAFGEGRSAVVIDLRETNFRNSNVDLKKEIGPLREITERVYISCR